MKITGIFKPLACLCSIDFLFKMLLVKISSLHGLEPSDNSDIPRCIDLRVSVLGMQIAVCNVIEWPIMLVVDRWYIGYAIKREGPLGKLICGCI